MLQQNRQQQIQTSKQTNEQAKSLSKKPKQSLSKACSWSHGKWVTMAARQDELFASDLRLCCLLSNYLHFGIESNGCGNVRWINGVCVPRCLPSPTDHHQANLNEPSLRPSGPECQYLCGQSLNDKRAWAVAFKEKQPMIFGYFSYPLFLVKANERMISFVFWIIL